MAKLLYITPASLDGYIGDGDYDWSAPDDELLAFINDLLRPVGTYLYGRKTYETMAVWESSEAIPGLTPVMLDFAPIWQAADKIVYSKSLKTVSTSKTRLEQEFDPEAIRALKAQSSRDLSVGGPTLAARAIRLGLVDEYHLWIAPILLGGGIPVFAGDVRVQLDLVEERRFSNGTVYVRYRLLQAR